MTPGVTAGVWRLHHRDIPELQADGASEREAASNLAQDLTWEIDWAADHHRRDQLGRALDDVRAFVRVP